MLPDVSARVCQGVVTLGLGKVRRFADRARPFCSWPENRRRTGWALEFEPACAPNERKAIGSCISLPCVRRSAVKQAQPGLPPDSAPPDCQPLSPASSRPWLVSSRSRATELRRLQGRIPPPPTLASARNA